MKKRTKFKLRIGEVALLRRQARRAKQSINSFLILQLENLEIHLVRTNLFFTIIEED